MRILSLLIFLLAFGQLFAQPEDATIEEIDGKRYYVHFVQTGNTLYGIQRLYKVPLQDIISANPGVENGISSGQRILVPLPGREGLSQNLLMHKVESKETLYGISKKYDVSLEQLNELNPELKEGLKVGQDLKIPVKNGQKVSTPQGPESANPFKTTLEKPKFKISFKDTLITHVVQKGETLYSISKRYMITEREIQEINDMRNSRIRPGDELMIAIKKERIEPVVVREIEPLGKNRFFDSLFLFRRKETYKITMFMPLFFDTPEREVVSDIATEYYMGAQMALDSLEKMGFNATVFVHDTRNDSVNLQRILNSEAMKGTDLIFGPFFGDNADIIAKWAKENGARMVSPFATNYEVLRENPMVYEAVTSDVTLARGLAKTFLKDSSNKAPVLLVKPQSKKDVFAYEAFRNTYLNHEPGKDRAKIIECTIADFATFIQKDQKTRIVFLSNNKGQVNQLINAINKAIVKWSNSDVVLYGTKDWVNYDNISTKYKNRYQVHFASPYHLDYTRPDMIMANRTFRDKYGTDLSKVAAQGFDVTLYFCEKLLMEMTPASGLMNKMIMCPVGPTDGFENTFGVLIRYDNYELKKVLEFHD
jgi:LysM repeat protein